MTDDRTISDRAFDATPPRRLDTKDARGAANGTRKAPKQRRSARFPKQHPTFAAMAPQWSNAGALVFPLAHTDEGKFKPAVVNWRKMRHHMAPETVKRFADHPGVGLSLDTNRLFLIDVDEPGVGTLNRVLDRYGDTPLITQTPNGHHVFYARPRGFPLFRLIGAHNAICQMDVLTEGLVVLAPSVRGDGSAYHFLRGAPKHFALLPTPDGIADFASQTAERRQERKRTRSGPARSQPTNVDHSPPRAQASSTSQPRPLKRLAECTSATIPEGERNKELFKLALRRAHTCTSATELADRLLEVNRVRCLPPLPVRDVQVVAKSAWSIQERGDNRTGTQSGLTEVAFAEIDRMELIIAALTREMPAAAALFHLLWNRWGGSPGVTFAVDDRGLSRLLGLSKGTMLRARRVLQSQGVIEVVRPAAGNMAAHWRFRR